MTAINHARTIPAVRHAPDDHEVRLKQWLTMDTRRTDALGWTFNLAIFRIIFLAYAVLPFARVVSN